MRPRKRKKKMGPPPQGAHHATRSQHTRATAPGQPQRPPTELPRLSYLQQAYQAINYNAALVGWISETLPGANWPEAGSGMVAITRCLSCDAPEAAAIDTACYPAEVRCQSCRLAVDLPAYLKAHGWPAPPPYPARHEMLTPPRERRLANDCY